MAMKWIKIIRSKSLIILVHFLCKKYSNKLMSNNVGGGVLRATSYFIVLQMLNIVGTDASICLFAFSIALLFLILYN